MSIQNLAKWAPSGSASTVKLRERIFKGFLRLPLSRGVAASMCLRFLRCETPVQPQLGRCDSPTPSFSAAKPETSLGPLAAARINNQRAEENRGCRSGHVSDTRPNAQGCSEMGKSWSNLYRQLSVYLGTIDGQQRNILYYLVTLFAPPWQRQLHRTTGDKTRSKILCAPHRTALTPGIPRVPHVLETPQIRTKPCHD